MEVESLLPPKVYVGLKSPLPKKETNAIKISKLDTKTG
ncbi:hypothetical protein MNB_SV-8-645 [hydrothermal vent metagenome]|uniref:Uncharacterized protein n=1 Tax=hydrothermal vent metagenome TaxID=652676 RepID=A0A1W1BMW1_9ZZZZ